MACGGGASATQGLALWVLLTVAGGNGLAMADVGDELGSAVSYDYRDALAKSILFFEGQRSGTLPTSQRVSWRGNSGLSDGMLDKVNLAGGYYDAGDNVKFGWPMAYTISLLGWAAVEYPREIASAKQMGYLQEAIRWGTNFLLRAHTSSTTLYTQVGDGNADHQCWERPEDMDTPRTLYKINASSPGSEAAADAAAALAAASIVFKAVDSGYSSTLLNHSKSLFYFADKYRSSFQKSCPFYCSYSGYQDELLWAAAWLYQATRDTSYLNYASNNQGWSKAVNEFSWDNKFAGAQTLLAKEFFGGKRSLSKFKTDADSFICALMPGSSYRQIWTTPGGLLYTRDGSNIQYVTGSATVLFAYSKALNAAKIGAVQCGAIKFSSSQIRAFAKSQVDYILGNNPMKMSYMVGFGAKSPTQLHHRGSSIPSIKQHKEKVSCNEGYSNWFNSGKPNPNTLVGALVGGPNSNDGFSDRRSDYAHMEPTTYMNAAFVCSLAPLVTQTNEDSLELLYTNTTDTMGNNADM